MAIGTGTALLASTALSAGSSLLGGMSQSKAANRAAAAQEAAARESGQLMQQAVSDATATQRNLYDQARLDSLGYYADAQNQLGQQRRDASPYLAAGTNALSSLSEMLTGRPLVQSSTTRPAGSDAAISAIERELASAQSERARMEDIPMEHRDMGRFDALTRQVQQLQEQLSGARNLVPSTEYVLGEDTGGPKGFTEYLETRDFETSPGYEFRLEQGNDALLRNASARGRLGTGELSKDIIKFSQGTASDEFGNWFNREYTGYADYANRLASLAGMGQTALGQTGATQAAGLAAGQGQGLAALSAGLGSNLANLSVQGAKYQGDALNNAALARASGYVGGANAMAGGLGGAGDAVQLASLLGDFGGGGGEFLGFGGGAPSFGATGGWKPSTYAGFGGTGMAGGASFLPWG